MKPITKIRKKLNEKTKIFGNKLYQGLGDKLTNPISKKRGIYFSVCTASTMASLFFGRLFLKNIDASIMIEDQMKSNKEMQKVLREYRIQNTTLDTLKKELDKTPEYDFPYHPKHIKQGLESIFGKDLSKRKALEDIIRLVKKDIKNLKSSTVFEDYESLNKQKDKNDGRFGLYLLGGYASLFCAAGTFRLYKDEKKKNQLD